MPIFLHTNTSLFVPKIHTSRFSLRPGITYTSRSHLPDLKNKALRVWWQDPVVLLLIVSLEDRQKETESMANRISTVCFSYSICAFNVTCFHVVCSTVIAVILASRAPLTLRSCHLNGTLLAVKHLLYVNPVYSAQRTLGQLCAGLQLSQPSICTKRFRQKLQIYKLRTRRFNSNGSHFYSASLSTQI